MRADYVEETTTSIAGTSGDGAVTLTQITGLPRFSTVLGTSARVVEYIIEDTVNLYFEKGYGSVSSNVLTRTQPRVTWNGTTYDDTSPSALQFGSSPTSGNIRIRMGALSDSFESAVMTYTSFSGGFDLGLICGDITGGAPNSGGFGLNSENWFPYLWRGVNPIDQFAVTAPVSNTGRSVKWALAEVTSSSLPGRILIQFGAISYNTSGVKTVSSSSFTPSGDIKLPIGHYYMGFVCDGAVDIAMADQQGARGSILGMSNYQRPIGTLTKTGNYSTGLTDNPTSLSQFNGNRPIAYLRPRT